MNKGIPSVLKLPLFALAFLAGDVCLQQQPQLPSLYWAGLLVPLIIFIYFWKKHYWLIFLLAGFFWSNLYGWNYLRSVPDQGVAGQNILISGVVAELPIKGSHSIKFRFDIDRFELEGYSAPIPEHIRLSWYYSNVGIRPGDRWQFVVRLKPPSGFQNPGGFDYEAWLYQQGIHATGYIRKSPLNKKIGDDGWFSLVDRIRFNIRKTINSNAAPEEAALLNALAIGYRGDMTADSWQVFIKTGTNHLVAISGLHIALIAGFVWAALHFLARIRFLRPYLSYRSLLVYSFIAALIYAALAGFTIPTQRALIMLAVVYAGMLLYRQITVLQSLSLALIIVLFISPTSVLSVGFWLSFLAVAAISYSIVGRLAGRNRLIVWLWPQVVVIVALMPFSFYFFQQSSVIALFANVMAIPAIATLILPVLMLALLLSVVHTGLSSVLFSIAANGMFYLVEFLRYLSEYEFSVWVHSEAGILPLILAMLGLALLFAPYAFPGRLLSVFLLMPLLFHKSEVLPENVFSLHVLDVGQGLSVFIRTKNHHLLYDAGGKFSGRFDVGEKAVLPFLRHQGITNLDRLIISNGDNDHIGGAQAVIDNIDTGQVIGRDIETLVHEDRSHCLKGQHWSWDGIEFEILHPQHQRYRKRNNYSCVLKVSNAEHSVLITGDIEKKAERELVKEQIKSLRADVLVVPHHGSKTSSSLSFLQAVNPKIAIYSSGYLNRYGFPRPEIIKRYREMGISQLNTADKGEISLIIDHKSLADRALSYRHQYQRYWHRTRNKINIE